MPSGTPSPCSCSLTMLPPGSHVLEHVDDKRALAELFRITSPGGNVILMFPIIEGWDQTYENPSVQSAAERIIHFGQDDHLRYFGRDVRTKIREAGFSLEEFTAEGPSVIRHGLLRGEKIFIDRKPNTHAQARVHKCGVRGVKSEDAR